VTLHNRDGSRRSVPLCRGGVPVLVLLGGLSAAPASDGDLQRILLEHACVKPQIETVLRQASLTAYRINCLGTAHKILDVLCDGHRCSASQRRDITDPP
jgi:hypothetical protein